MICWDSAVMGGRHVYDPFARRQSYRLKLIAGERVMQCWSLSTTRSGSR